MENLACPWSNYLPATMAFCEKRLCGLVTEPANTWSNIGFLIVSVYLIWRARTSRQPELMPIGLTALAVFIGSTLFHSTSTFAGELVDLGAMFLFVNFAIVFNFRRIFPATTAFVRIALYWTATVLALALMLYHRSAGILIFTGLVVLAGVLEIAAGRLEKPSPQRRYLWYLCGTFAVSYLFWNLDYRHILCDPNNHFMQGHAVWHLLNSFCFLWLYKYQEQFLPKLRM